MPFFGPLQLSSPMAGGDPRLTAFIRALQGQGATGITSYPGPGGMGTSALGYTAAAPLNVLEPAGGAVPITQGGTPESLTGIISGQQAIQGLGRQDGGGGGAPGVGLGPSGEEGGLSGLTGPISGALGIGLTSDVTASQAAPIGGWGQLGLSALGFSPGPIGTAATMAGLANLGIGAVSAFGENVGAREVTGRPSAMDESTPFGQQRAGEINPPGGEEAGPIGINALSAELGATPGTAGPNIGPGVNADTGGLGATPGTASGLEGGDVGGGGGGGGGATVLCTVCYRHGFMPTSLWLADCEYGETVHPIVLRGYQRWATRLAAWVERHPWAASLLWRGVRPWAEEMERRVTGRGKGSTVGAAMMAIGEPLCRWLGRNMR